METLVKRSPHPAFSTVALPAAILQDEGLSVEAIRLYADLVRAEGWRTEGPPAEAHLRARLELENAGWLLVHRGEGVTVLVPLNTRNVDAWDAIREAFPQASPDGPDSTPEASVSPQAPLPLPSEGLTDGQTGAAA